ncbi:MAG TPA: tripartite tricarboxylate transporter substrate binding protein [Caldimonas sp.]|jgi:tripartite-type tricarboxylate transporter receptor subunit TctC|nr:tripartite tricarboxylate transporter substrate binding protein [Caldimonas sp.]
MSRTTIAAALRTVGLGVALAVCAASAAACPPERVLSVVVPYSAGGSLDATTRVVAEAVAKRLGRPLQVRNVPGASGLIGAREVASAAADGCTILSGTVNTMVLIPLLDPHARFAPSDFVPVAKIGSTALVLLAGPQVGALRLADLHRDETLLGRTLAVGHPGNDTLQAFAIDSMEQALGMRFIHVPYSGSAPLIGDLIGGRLDLAVVATPVARQLLKLHRVRQVVELDTVAGVAAESWNGWFVPAHTTDAELAPLRRALVAALGDKTVVAQLRSAGVEPTAPALAASVLTREIAADTTRYSHSLASRVDQEEAPAAPTKRAHQP